MSGTVSRKRRSATSIVEDVEGDLECPVCTRPIFDPPVRGCVNMHIFCDPCFKELRKDDKPCAVCRGKLTDARNVAVEKIIRLKNPDLVWFQMIYSVA